MARQTKTVRIPNTLHKKVKKHAISKGMKLEAWVSQSLSASLPETKEEK